MAFPCPLDATQAKVFVILAKRHFPLFSRVSMNILREVCAYISDTLLLPVARMSSTDLRIVDLERKTMQVRCFDRVLSSGSALCMIRRSVLLKVGGGRPAGIEMTFDLETKLTQVEQPMKTSRNWPGIVTYQDFAYVFGGNPNGTMLASCEKFHLRQRDWTNCPDMHTPKSCFTPCVYLREIYLANSDHQEKQVEVFTPASEQYRLLPLRLSSKTFGSVSFILEGELYILSYDKMAYKWRLDSAETTPIELHCKVSSPAIALCNGTVLRHREFIYWANYSGSVLRFSWTDSSLTVLDDKFS